jgi:hypothetical protein
MIGKAIRVGKAVHKIAKAENPGKAAGAVVGAALPLGTRTIGAKVTEVAVNKGIEIAKDPAVQAKVKQVATNVAKNTASTAANAARGIRRGAASGARKVQAFRESHGK